MIKYLILLNFISTILLIKKKSLIGCVTNNLIYRYVFVQKLPLRNCVIKDVTTYECKPYFITKKILKSN